MRKVVVAACFLVLVLGSLSPSFLAAKPQEPQSFVTPSPIVQASNQFTLDLYARFRTQPGNLIFSGFNVSTALAMAHAGARGQTASQMAKVLHFPQDRTNLDRDLGKLLKTLRSRPKVTLELANALWGQKGYPFRKDLLDRLRTSYHAPLNQVDFANNPGDAQRRMKSWVARHTGNQIRDFNIPVDNLTRFTITSAIYFKGSWMTRFEKGSTRDEDFTIAPGKTVKVPMMHCREGLFAVAHTDDCTAVALPYVGNDLAMVVLLPNDPDGLARLETSLTVEGLSKTLSALKPAYGEGAMPRFTIRRSFSLSKELAAMGMSDAFDPERADFSGIAGRDQPLSLQFVEHEAFIVVDETGTKAAAVTGVGFCAASTVSQAFRIDRPFLYLIGDMKTGTILFMGRILDPTQS